MCEKWPRATNQNIERKNMDNAEQLKRDEERIKHDQERLKHDEERLARDEGRLIQDKKVKYFFSLDGKKYESDTSSINGADVRAKLPPEKAGYAIYLEAHGNEPDKQITDTQSFSLEEHPLCFYSVPPATFGLL
jgi:CRISPR/Cas system-associated exonuclease Cas4 (RecB family)